MTGAQWSCMPNSWGISHNLWSTRH